MPAYIPLSIATISIIGEKRARAPGLRLGVRLFGREAILTRWR